ncbi:MAG TPA: YraN family protein [Patescibacteria group bacterium]|nr:YraN family protein [Patescibacteria group bacterium]
MDLFRKELGRKGEELAKHYLVEHGYQIVQQNFLLRNGEIDIIAIENPESKDRTLVFFEVKTRTSNDYGTPLEAITYYKMKALVRAAEVFKHSHKNLPDALRIDAIAVTVLPNGELVNIEHVKNISE